MWRKSAMLSLLKIIFRKDTLFSKPLGVFPLEPRRGAFISETSPASRRQRCLEVRACPSGSLSFRLYWTAVVFLKPPVLSCWFSLGFFNWSHQPTDLGVLLTNSLAPAFPLRNLPSSALTTRSEGPRSVPFHWILLVIFFLFQPSKSKQANQQKSPALIYFPSLSLSTQTVEDAWFYDFCLFMDFVFCMLLFPLPAVPSRTEGPPHRSFFISSGSKPHLAQEQSTFLLEPCPVALVCQHPLRLSPKLWPCQESMHLY